MSHTQLVERVRQAPVNPGECDFYATDLELAAGVKQILLDGGVPAYLQELEAPLIRVAAPRSHTLRSRTLLERKLGRVVVTELDHTLLFQPAPPRPELLSRPPEPEDTEALAEIVFGLVAHDSREACTRLKQLGAPGAEALYGLLVRCCAEGRLETGWLLAGVLARCQTPLAQEFLDLLAHPEPAVRLNAVSFMPRIGSAEGVPALIALLRDPHETLRAEASSALWELTGETFDFDPTAPPEARETAVCAWEAWLDKWS